MKNKLLAFALSMIFVCSSFAAEPLKLNLEKDKKYSVLSTSESTIIQNMNGMEMNINNKSVHKISFLVISKESDHMVLKVSFDSITNEMNMPGRSSVSSSVKPGDPKNAEDFMNTAFYILSKNPLDVKMSYTGKVIEIQNAKPVLTQVMTSLDSLPQTTQMQTRPMLEMMLNEAALKSMIEMITFYFPENNESDNWSNNMVISAQGMNLTVKSKFKVKDQKNNQTTIAGESVIEPAGDGKMNMNGMELTFDLRGMGNGELTLDTTSGWIQKGKAKQRMQGSITANGMNIPMQVETKTEYKKVD